MNIYQKKNREMSYLNRLYKLDDYSHYEQDEYNKENTDEISKYIHTNFKLSSTGEKLGIIYKAENSDVFVDSVSFGAQGSNEASARIPDGSPIWVFPVVPTPGQPNQ